MCGRWGRDPTSIRSKAAVGLSCREGKETGPGDTDTLWSYRPSVRSRIRHVVGDAQERLLGRCPV